MMQSALFQQYRADMVAGGEYHGWSAAKAFGPSDQEFLAATRGIACFDSSFRGRLSLTGRDGLDLLNRLSTNDLRSLKPGQTIGTVLTTDKARIVDFLALFHGGERLLLMSSPTKSREVRSWIEKFTILEDVAVRDVTADTVMISFIGPQVDSAISSFLPGGPEGGSTIPVPWGQIAVVRERRANTTEVHLMTEATKAVDFWRWIAEARLAMGDQNVRSGSPVPLIGYRAYEGYRIAEGIPMVGSELTQDHTPYDIGLREFISYTKGCYIGQEVIARLDTYQKVRRRLVGLLLSPDSAPVAQGAALTAGGKEAGHVTSVTQEPVCGARLALAVVRSDVVESGATVTCSVVQGKAVATVSELPVRWP